MSSSNRGVAYIKQNVVEVQTIPFPKLDDPRGKRIDHGVILKVVTTNICGSDQHMVRGRSTAPAGLILGHEITGEVLELGRDVETLRKGDLVSVPFNVACGRCRTCKGAAHRRVPDGEPLVLNALMEVTRPAGKIGIPGLYVIDDPGAEDTAAKRGALSIRLGLGWAKSHSFFTGQTPVMKYTAR